jgi:hypothetical protein
MSGLGLPARAPKSAVILDALFADNGTIGGKEARARQIGRHAKALAAPSSTLACLLVIDKITKFHDNFASTANDDISSPFSVT